MLQPGSLIPAQGGVGASARIADPGYNLLDDCPSLRVA